MPNILIAYKMVVKSPYGRETPEIELCGEFTSLEHFKRFCLVEESYNRFVRSHEVIGERNGKE